MSDKNDKKNTEFESEEYKKYLTRKEMRHARREIRRQMRAGRSPVRYLFWGLILILFAVIVFLYGQQILTLDNLWKAIITGLGAVFLVQSGVLFFNPAHRSRALGSFIPGVILLFIGLGFLFGFTAWSPLALVVAGVAVLFISWFLQREIERRRYTRRPARERGQIPTYHRQCQQRHYGDRCHRENNVY